VRGGRNETAHLLAAIWKAGGAERCDLQPIETKSPIRFQSERIFLFMTDDEKKEKPVKPLTPDILRKMAASGKSLPPVEQEQPPKRGRCDD
jgi:hypothetical protein